MTNGRERGRGVKRLAFMVIAVAVMWSGHWFYASWQVRSSTDAWFEARQTAGWTARHDGLSVSGFPNRVDRTFTNLTLREPGSGITWQTPRFDVYALSYRPRHVIAAWPEPQTLTTDQGTWTIDGEGLAASLVSDTEGLLRADAQAEILNLSRDDGRALALADVAAAFHRVPVDVTCYRLALTAGSLATDRTPALPAAGAASAVQLDMEISFDSPFMASALDVPHPQPREIVIRLAELHWGKTVLRLTGTLVVDADGVPEGTLTVQARDWRALIAAARDAGTLPQPLADTIEDGLAMLAALKGNPETIDVPLSLSGGLVKLGPVPIGRAPNLSLP